MAEGKAGCILPTPGLCGTLVQISALGHEIHSGTFHPPLCLFSRYSPGEPTSQGCSEDGTGVERILYIPVFSEKSQEPKESIKGGKYHFQTLP